METNDLRWKPILIIANLVIINLVIILFLNKEYPFVGYDYNLAIPSMLDSALHFRNNGLTTQWYTPSFGGGIPGFPDPNNIQFSLLGILPIWMDPWQAVYVSSIIYISLGFLASYRFFKKILNFSWHSSILGAVFFSANGFMIQRITIGHLGYQPFPLLAILILLFFDTSLTPLIAGLLIGLIATLVIYQAGYFLIVVFILSILMVFPLLYISRSSIFSWKRITTILLTGGVIALLVSAAKLSAVYSFMRFFPRTIADDYTVDIFQGIFGIMLQILGTMSLIPLFLIANVDPNILPLHFISTTSVDYGYWEFDMSMSPIIFCIFLVGLNKFLLAPRKHIKEYAYKKKWVAVLLFILFVWLSVEFILAKGLFYPFLRQLPILSSMHVNARFTAVFLFPIAALATILYNSWSIKWTRKKSTLLFILLNILTLLPLSSYFLVKDDLEQRIYDITQSYSISQSIRSGEKFEITRISDNESNTQALKKGISNLKLYDPIFGYKLENFHPEVRAGSIWDVTDGYYNMTNPSGYVFPENNESRPFERIRLQDREKLITFANYYQPEWKFPLYQQVFNWISTLTLLGTLIFLLLYGLVRWRKAKI